MFLHWPHTTQLAYAQQVYAQVELLMVGAERMEVGMADTSVLETAHNYLVALGDSKMAAASEIWVAVDVAQAMAVLGQARREEGSTVEMEVTSGCSSIEITNQLMTLIANIL